MSDDDDIAGMTREELEREVRALRREVSAGFVRHAWRLKEWRKE